MKKGAEKIKNHFGKFGKLLYILYSEKSCKYFINGLKVRINLGVLGFDIQKSL